MPNDGWGGGVSPRGDVTEMKQPLKILTLGKYQLPRDEFKHMYVVCSRLWLHSTDW